MGVKSELVINDVNERDFGNYTCKASNVYGYSKYQILMKPKGELVKANLYIYINAKLAKLFLVFKVVN